MDQLVVRPIRIEGESRFQRWRLGVYRILGRCPRLTMNAAPLAPNISSDKETQARKRQVRVECLA
jgi:hypothetical protein